MIRAVVFDVFGTLVHIEGYRRPHHRLLAKTSLMSFGRNDVMRRPLSLSAIAAAMGVQLASDELQRLEADLVADQAAVRAFPEVSAVWHTLRARGIKLGLCSNLALGYAEPALAALPFPPDACAWSYAVGAIKPEPAIYTATLAMLGVASDEALMVGDTYEADVLGPRAIGMQAVHLQRQSRTSHPERGIADLTGLLALV